MLLTVAELLSARRRDLPGAVSFVFQPAEEAIDGAAGMLDDGVLEPRPGACFGLHLWNDLQVGQIDARDGPVYASSDEFLITLRGSGGHAAMPHQVADPVVASAHLIVALQTLVSRESPPLEPAVLTIGTIHGGTVPNIIPESVEMHGTLRAFEPAVRERLLDRMRALVSGFASTFRLEAAVRMTNTCPATINDAEMAELVRAVGARLLGPDNVRRGMRTTGSEDMALFLNEIPGCFFFVGSANAQRGLSSAHHSPTFDFDERALDVGARMLTGVALEFLER
ncbi:MAG: M20 family metallopeptidase [Chloroflexi bacterium]|nr:M20 family metallopeptidase [Chloroflexota bacterium]